MTSNQIENEIKELKAQRKPSEEFILKYLDKIDENVIEISSGKLRKNRSETKVPLSQDIIRDAIKDKINNVTTRLAKYEKLTYTDEILVEDIMKHMDDSRPLKTRTNLKRTSNRPAKKKPVKARRKMKL